MLDTRPVKGNRGRHKRLHLVQVIVFLATCGIFVGLAVLSYRANKNSVNELQSQIESMQTGIEKLRKDVIKLDNNLHKVHDNLKQTVDAQMDDRQRAAVVSRRLGDIEEELAQIIRSAMNDKSTEFPNSGEGVGVDNSPQPKYSAPLYGQEQRFPDTIGGGHHHPISAPKVPLVQGKT